MQIDKTRVKIKFDKGLQTYDSCAHTQRRVSVKLVQMLVDMGFNYFPKSFEVGCGSGFLTQQLMDNIQIKELLVNDISCTSAEQIKNMATQYHKPIGFLCGDAEKILFPKNNDAIFSSSAIQWFNKVGDFFDKVNASLNPKGIFAFSTFGPDNFKEIRHLTGIGLDYYTLEELAAMLFNDFVVLAVEEWREIMEFQHPKEVLRHIKQTGVNGLKQQYFGKQELFDFIQKYTHQFSTARQTVTLSYHPIIIIAQKK